MTKHIFPDTVFFSVATLLQQTVIHTIKMNILPHAFLKDSIYRTTITSDDTPKYKFRGENEDEEANRNVFAAGLET